ncbi:hypothetical protein Dip510_000028 [Elusimicrobium posterum]|uniref:hypothetical protein n=1 Tax=Elusimicrobium posterum TaxID=3116653 RepID=UPI003C791AAE
MKRLTNLNKILLLLTLCAAGIYFFNSYQSRTNQFLQAQKTLRVLRSLALWQQDIFRNNSPEKNWAEVMTVEFFDQTPYQEFDYYFRFIAQKPDFYIYARMVPEGFGTIPHALYMDMEQKTFYCMAYSFASNSQKLCERLGGKEDKDGLKKISATLKESREELDEFIFYRLEWDKYPAWVRG